jgi:predicted phage tail protein
MAKLFRQKMDERDMTNDIPESERDNWNISKRKMRKDGSSIDAEISPDLTTALGRFCAVHLPVRRV